MHLHVATWNLNARTHARPVPGWVGRELVGLQADMLVLTEYVPGGEDPSLAQVFQEAGGFINAALSLYDVRVFLGQHGALTGAQE